MSETKDQDKKKTLSLAGKSKLSLKGTPASGKVRQSFTHGRSKTVAVEVKRTKRGERPTMNTGTDAAADDSATGLTSQEREARARALLEAEKRREEGSTADDSVSVTRPKAVKSATAKTTKKAEAEAEAATEKSPVDLREKELEELRKIQEAEASKRQEEAARLKAEEDERNRKAEASKVDPEGGPAAIDTRSAARKALDEEEEKNAKRKPGKLSAAARGNRRQSGKLTVTQAQNFDQLEDSKSRGRSLAAQRRARERERMKARQSGQMKPPQKVTREVIVPETITVQELANRMAERSGEIVKKLMEMGVMATINQIIDADTAELLCEEFGHKIKRVSEADVEIGMSGDDDREEDLLPRPPVVTVMGHVDHGKTSLLDAIRKTDVVGGEAGGITQHIGAYQITLEGGNKITFIDTPGHEAFSEMRSRGADVTDIVVLVVAANDSVMPQTIEAINHARAAEVPVIVAINKCDLPDANPDKVRQDLLQHEIVVESYSGDVQDVEVSAKTGAGLKELEETILLQAEILEVKANPNRKAVGAVIEAKVEHGRGSVATVLIKKGTLRVGDVFVTGCEDGRVRAILDDRGNQIEEAIPGQPVEVLGLNATPEAGDDFVVVNDEARAREIAEFRGRRKRELTAAGGAKGTNLEQLFSQLKADEIKKMDVIIKGDVHGSVEAIKASLEKLTLDNEEVSVRVLHTGVGAINNSDVTLANTTNALIIGFNVRANDQAREMAAKDKVDIRYFSVIYDAIDEVRKILSGMLEPTLRENYLGRSEIRQVFSVGKTGKVAGCMVLDGIVKRGAGVRLLRDNVVIHEGKLKTLRRFKDEVKDVREGFECGMAFENYDDIKEGDVIEAFEVEEVAREL